MGYLSDKLRANLLLKQYFLEVELQHVVLYNEEMAHAIQEQPAEIVPRVCVSYIEVILLTEPLCYSLKQLQRGQQRAFSSPTLSTRASHRMI